MKVTSDTELSLLKSKIAEIKMQLKQEKAGSLQVDGGVSLGTYVTWKWPVSVSEEKNTEHACLSAY